MGFFEECDWGAQWREMQASRRKPDQYEYWDKRAEDFHRSPGHGEYYKQFMSLAGMLPGESVFDMGCGSGTLAVPLARDGHDVVAVDFSANMLSFVDADAAKHGVSERVRTIRASWEDDWDKAGIPVCDVAVASRSIAVADMEEALLKLDGRAKRRVCVTLATSYTPRSDPKLWRAIGREPVRTNDTIYAVNILYSHGLFPELRYIESRRNSSYASFEEAHDHIERSIGGVADGTERDAYERFCREHIVESEDEFGNPAWHKDYMQLIRWGFVSWYKQIEDI